jgi:branched-chain amino acid transport system substrate-binding protein
MDHLRLGSLVVYTPCERSIMADMDRNGKDGEGKGLLGGKEVSRRDFLKLAGVAGATVGLGAGLGGLVAACGTDDAAVTTVGGAATTVPGGTSTTVSAVELGREIKIGFVSPQTGGIAPFGVPDKYCMGRAQEAFGDSYLCGDGKMHKITIDLQDTQSDTARASSVTGDLINNKSVDMVLTGSTPDTVNPVATQCEALETPCLSTDCPWQPYIDRANVGDFTVSYKWCYHTFWGLEDVIANFSDMWGQLVTNNKVGACWSNDPDGQAWAGGWGAAFEPLGLTATIPSQFTVGAMDFSTQINQFSKDGCEIGVGMFIPPDFGTFWTQVNQLGWKPRAASFGKGLLFPEVVAGLSGVVDGLTTEVWWMPTHPFKSSLNGETCQQFADKYTEKNPGTQWSQPLLHFIVFDWAADVLKRTTDLDDKTAIMTAVKATKLDTIGGLIDFTAAVTGAGGPATWTPGPQHIHENVYKTAQVGGQWRKGTTYPFELTVVSNAACPDAGIAVQDTVKELVWS